MILLDFFCISVRGLGRLAEFFYGVKSFAWKFKKNFIL